MTKQPVSLYIAIVLAGVGCFLAIRSLMNTAARAPVASAIEVPESVRSALTNAKLDTVPTHATMDAIERELRGAVLEKIRAVPTLSSLPAARLEDLAQAFVERWRALIDPDVARDHQTLAARGDPRSLVDASKQYQDYREWMDSLSMSSVGLDGVVVTDGADLAALASAVGVAGFEGFRRGSVSRNADKMPVPDSPSDAGWRSVQIVMPFEKQPLRGKGFGVVFLGFQFAWSPQRGQWVPYSAVWYVSPDEVHAAAPFR